MQVTEILKQYQDLVWPVLKKYLVHPDYPRQFQIPSRYSSPIQRFHWEPVFDYPTRKGKYLRPTLLLLITEAMGGNLAKALNTAAAMQLSEEWLLVHDDFEDESVERRGKPALQRIHGSKLAVNAGDSLHILMWKAVNENLPILGEEKFKRVADEFVKILFRTTVGQAVEIGWTGENKSNSDQDWYFISDGKSAYYSCAGPIRLGAIIAGTNNQQLDLLSEFGLNLGRCFQMVDDILDVTSDFAGLKKQTGNDIYEGKRTVILGHLAKSASAKDKQKLTKILEKPRNKKDKKEVEWIIGKMNEYGSISHARRLAELHRDKALEIFNNRLSFLTNQPARDKIEILVNFILDRDH